MAEITSTYAISNEKLIQTVQKALTTNTSVRDAITTSFAKLNVFEVKNFIENSLNYPLNKSFKTTWANNMKQYPESSIRNYFGEKIALYFAFVNHFRDRTIKISPFGIIVSLLQVIYYIIPQIMEHNKYTLTFMNTFEGVYEFGSIFLGVIIVVWGKRLQITWENYEKEFAIRYGMTNMEEIKEVRSKFHGAFNRSLVDDTINELQEIPSQVKAKKLLQYFFLFIYCILTFYASSYLLDYKRRAFNEKLLFGVRNPDPNYIDKNSLEFNEITFNVLEFARIIIFQEIFRWILKRLLRWQSRKLQEDVEESLILNLGLYQLFNNGVVIVITGLQSLMANVTMGEDEDTPGELVEIASTICTRNDCAQEIAMFFLAYCILSIGWLIFTKVLVQSIIIKIIKKIKDLIINYLFKDKNYNEIIIEKDDASINELMSDRSHLQDDQHKNFAQENKQHKGIHKKDIYKEKQEKLLHAFYTDPAKIYHRVNSEIDHQVKEMEDYETKDSNENVEKYLSLFNAYSATVMFGISLPLSFILCWLISVLESYLDIYYLLKVKRRDTPKSCKTIGLWLELMDLVSMLSIWFNSFYVAFILYYDHSTKLKLSVFVGMSIGLTLILLVYNSLNAGLSSKVKVMISRAEFIRKFIFTSQEPESRTKDNVLIQSSYRVFGDTNAKRKQTDLLAVAEQMQKNRKLDEKLKVELENYEIMVRDKRNSTYKGIHNTKLQHTQLKRNSGNSLIVNEFNISAEKASISKTEVKELQGDVRKQLDMIF